MSKQDQFLDVIDRDLAERRFQAALTLAPVGEETVPLPEALGRVLAGDVIAQVDVPSFDRSNYDGFALRAADSIGADEHAPKSLRLLGPALAAGEAPAGEVGPQTATPIATGGMLPRGADAVMMIEHTDLETADGANPSEDTPEREDQRLVIRRAVAPGFGVAFAGCDIAQGETVLRQGDLLTSRETGVLAAIGVSEVDVFRRPRVAIISTGDELIAPGAPMRPARVYDSNAQILADAIRELGGEPLSLGIVRDDANQLRAKLREAMRTADVALLSGGTSKGDGDLSYRVVSELTDPGVVAHGVALKPGKPICLAASGGKPVVILPGFPTSAIFTFHEFVAPVILALGGRASTQTTTRRARLAVNVRSEIGRTEYLLVGLVAGAAARARDAQATVDPQEAAVNLREAAPHDSLAAYPMGKGSGSVTTFSRADGFIRIDRYTEIVEQGAAVDVQLLGHSLQVADLVVIGSHCVGLDFLLSAMQRRGWRTKFLAVGSTAGLEAARRGECDLAGVHLLDAESGQYNRPFLSPDVELIAGYRRRQGVLFRPGDSRFEGKTAAEAVALAASDPDCRMINRNQGSGTRVLIDRLLEEATPARQAGAARAKTSAADDPSGERTAQTVSKEHARPAGYAVQPRSHSAVAAAIAQGRADWGVAVEVVARQRILGFLPLQNEQYDFVAARSRRDRGAVKAFVELLEESETARQLQRLGCERSGQESGERTSVTTEW